MEITIHNKFDPSVSVTDEYTYRQKVMAADSLDLLVQVYTDLDGHCQFTRDQLLDTVEAMDWWLAEEDRPPQVLFDSDGFDHSFVAPPPPFGQLF